MPISIKRVAKPMYIAIATASLFACGGNDNDTPPDLSPTATPSPTITPTAAPTPEPTVLPTATPAPTMAPTATPTPIVTATPTATPTVVVTPTPTAVPSVVVTPTPTAAPTATVTPTPVPSSPDTAGTCEDGVYCFDFDGSAAVPEVLKPSGNIEVSSEQAFSGDSAVKVSATGGGYNRNYLALDLKETALADQMYGRMMVWVDDPGGNGGDFTFAQADGKPKLSTGAPADTTVSYRYRIAGTARPGTVMANYDTRVDTNNDGSNDWDTDCWDHSEKILPRETWACVEWHFDAEADELKYWINGQEVEDIHVQSQGEGCINNDTQNGDWFAPAKFDTLYMGVEQYHNGVPARTMFIDDVSIDTQYVGCPEGDYLNTPIDTVESSEDFVPGEDGNLISGDGTFTNGQSSFVGFYNVANTGAVSWNDEARFEITADTAEIWHVQMHHTVNLDEGSEYTICFDAKADEERTIEYDIDLGADPWSSVTGEAETVTLSTEYQQFSKTFTALADDDVSRLVFSLGLAGVSTSIDNVGVFEGNSCREVVQPKESEAAPLEPYLAPKASTAPVIDGTIDAVWDSAEWQAIDVLWLGAQTEYPTPEDYTGRYKAMWDEGQLYLLFDITDDVLYDHTPAPLESYWNDDTVEIFIDENASGGNHQNENFANAWAYHISTLKDNVDSINGTATLLNDHVTVEIKSEGTRHIWEMSMRVYGEDYAPNAVNTPVVLSAGKEMGFSASYIDNDNSPASSGGVNRESMMGSVDTVGHQNNQGYINADVLGKMKLVD